MSTAKNMAADASGEHQPPVPASAIRVARIGGTLSLLAAAAISFTTLCRLGRLMGLQPGIAWLLPAALDIYAGTSIWVGFQIPEGHRARASAVWNARLALLLSVACNALSHALVLSAAGNGWTGKDISLTAVSALPPIVVERLLHLQTLIGTPNPGTPGPDSRQDVAPDRTGESRPVRLSGPGTNPDRTAIETGPGSSDQTGPTTGQDRTGQHNRTAQPDNLPDRSGSQKPGAAGPVRQPASTAARTGQPTRQSGPVKRATLDDLEQACRTWADTNGRDPSQMSRNEVLSAVRSAGYSCSTDRATNVQSLLDTEGTTSEMEITLTGPNGQEPSA